MSVRIGVDVGGTFTDIVCFDERRGRLNLLKVPSTPTEPDRAVIRGTERILSENALDPRSVRFFLHGTTVATNTLLEGKGAEVVLLVTRGFRDVMQIMRQDRPRLYDYFVQRPEPLVPRSRRLEVTERILYTGEVQTPICIDSIYSILKTIKETGVVDVAVCLLHSYANPQHEQILRSRLREVLPEARVSLSSEILPEFKEFERMSTTVVNAYVLPRVSKYIQDLQEGLTRMGIPSSLHIMQSNGGLITTERAKKHSVQTILSGPAAGALAGFSIAEQAGYKDIITIDIGGTSADVALARNGRLHFADDNEIAGHVIKAPMIEIQTVGAGGGSIAWIDSGGALQVGPHSAGADPGPACYGRGGTEPTVTDANVVLGRINPSYFLGGEMTIEPAQAVRAVMDKVSAPLGLNLETSAEGILKVINAVMAKTIRRLSVERGHDPRDFTLICFGGGGPLHAVDLALELQIPRVLVPLAPGVSSALGLLTADFRHDYVRTLLWLSEKHLPSDLESQLSILISQAQAQMNSDGVPTHAIHFLPSIGMRYLGQGHSLDVHFSVEELRRADSFSWLENQFHEKHQTTFGYADMAHPLEMVNLRLTAISELQRPHFQPLPEGKADADRALKGTRRVYQQGAWKEFKLYDRSKLNSGDKISGPAIIEQPDSTILFYAQQDAHIDPTGNVVIQVKV